MRKGVRPAKGDPRGTRIGSATFLVTVGSVASLVVSTLTQMLIAAIFGAGREMDAFFTSAVVPTYLCAVLLAGLNFVLVPAVIHLEEEGNAHDGWALVWTALLVLSAVFCVLTVAIAVAAPQIINLIAPGLSEDKSGLASALLRVQILALPFMGVGSVAAGVRNAHNSFLLPALAPVFGSIATLMAVVVLHSPLGIGSLAWGSVASYAVIACLNVWPLMHNGTMQLMRLSDPRILELGRLVLPFVLFGLLQRASPLFERYYASGLPDGQLSYLGYAAKVAGLMTILVGSGIATAILPALSREYSRGGRKALAALSERALMLTLAVAAPCVVFFFVAGTSFTQVFLGRGSFDQVTSAAVGSIVGLAALVVMGTMFGNVAGRTCYVMKITWSTPLVGTVSLLLYLALASRLSTDWQFRGLIVAQAVSTLFSVLLLMALLMWFLHVRLRGLWKAVLIFAGFGGLVGVFLHNLLGLLGALSPLAEVLLAATGISGAFAVLIYIYDRQLFQMVLELVGLGYAKRAGQRLQGLIRP